MNLRLIVGGVLFSGIFAHAQIKSGTIIVFAQTSSGFVIAADSRVTVDDKPSEDKCKISAFKSNRVVFSATGAAGYTKQGPLDLANTWDAFDEAKAAVLQEWSVPVPVNAQEAANRLSSVWESKMINRWQEEMLVHPDAFKRAAGKAGGYLTNGVFTIAYKSQIAMALSSIVYADGTIKATYPPSIDCSSGAKVCSGGETDIVTKYTRFGPFMPDTDPVSRVIKLVELTICEDKSGTVGGPVDALEMLNDGTINWKLKKEACLDSQDEKQH